MSGWLVVLLGVGIGWIGGVASTLLLAYRLTRGQRVIRVPTEATDRHVNLAKVALEVLVRERGVLQRELAQRTGLPASMFEPDRQIRIVVERPREPEATLIVNSQSRRAAKGDEKNTTAREV